MAISARAHNSWTNAVRRGVEVAGSQPNSCDSMAVADSFDTLARAVPSRPAGDLDDAQMLAKAPDGARWNLTVVDIARIAQEMLRVTMSAPGLDSLKWIPAQDFTLLIARVDGRDTRRRYTIAGQQDDTVLCDVYLHGQVIGTPWAGALRKGGL